MRVRWLGTALSDLDTIAEYISRDKLEAAARFVEIIENSVNLLRTHPSAGRPGRIVGTRELIITGTPYIVPYRVRADTIEILRVYHAARRWPTTL